ncbi:hypothetical protein [Yersinia bercovieri]|uniref:hypothetical protein n=1 Tax=Yersinia bercovieri TaxID=634 RepID=UPI0011A49BB4|nr:hypothetical protein [Yersinia bercovieri]
MPGENKERPILFNTEMVNAILSGRKTQTRRIMKVQPQVTEQRLRELDAWQDGFSISQQVNAAFQSGFIDVKYPQGQPGDQLWVRETWQGPLVPYNEAYEMFQNPEPYQKVENCVYRADGGPCPEFTDADDDLRQGWRPSIHMPRWASRISLLITGIRVERLNDVCEESAKAEGAQQYDISRLTTDEINLLDAPLKNPDTPYTNGFALLWESCYGSGSWAANPWVWVIDFEKIN